MAWHDMVTGRITNANADENENVGDGRGMPSYGLDWSSVHRMGMGSGTRIDCPWVLGWAGMGRTALL